MPIDFSTMQFAPTNQYIIISIIISAIFGLCAFAFILFSALVQKRHRALGIVAASFQLVNFVATAVFVICFCMIDLNLIINMSEKTAKIVTEYLNANMGLLLAFSLSSMLMLASFVISTVYFAKLIRGRGKRTVSILALIFHIAIFMILQPTNGYVGVLTENAQLAYDIVRNIISIAPCALTFANSVWLYKKWKKGEISLDEPVYNAGFNPYADPFFNQPLQTNFYPNNPTNVENNKTEYTVILKSVGFHKLDAVKIVQEVLDITIEEARFLVLESPLPNTIAKDVPRGIATELELRLTNIGAKVELI